MMPSPSPLNRFFKPAAGKVGSPHTPAPRGAAETEGPNMDGAVATPPTTGGRKRGAAAKSAAQREPKKVRSSAGAAAAAPAATPVEEPAPSAVLVPAPDSLVSFSHAPAPAPAALPPMLPAAPAHAPLHDTGAPADLKATLQQAQRAAPGSLPPFTAECFHHHVTGGSPYSWPSWLKPEGLRDVDGKRPSDPGFNQGTLWVPGEKVQKDEGHGTPMLLQYWKLKARHFDKVALFKVGKFYEVFYYDAFIAQRVCNLKWMAQDRKPHVGFPEMAKHDYAKQLVDSGYKVVVVEQVERAVEAKQRTAGEKGPTCVDRDACEVFTQGTLVDAQMLGGPGARHMMYLHFEAVSRHSGVAANSQLPFAACLVDCATSQIQVGRVVDAVDRNALRTLLAQVQPSEVVYGFTNLPADVLAMLKRLPCRPQLSPLRADAGILAARNRVAKYRTAFPGKLPASVESALAEDGSMMAAAGAMEYLETVLLGQRVLPFAVWDTLDAAACGPGAVASSRKRMVLDATALVALEILETLEGTYKGSLMDFMDHTSTPSGFRLLKQWLCAPLYEAAEIRARQEAVEFFIQQGALALQISGGLKKVAVDLERATSRVWGFALQSERHAVMYEDTTAKRLGDFMGLLKAFQQSLDLLASAFPAARSIPERLAQITRTPKAGGCLPELGPTIARLMGSAVEEVNPKTGKVRHRPQDGADARYDQMCRQIGAVLAQLEAEVQAVRKAYPRGQFTFMHRQPGYRYEVECEDGAVPPAFLQGVEVTYRNKSKLRFWTPRIKELIAELDKLEDEREDCIFPFLSQLFQQFHGDQAHFRAAVRCISEVDALLSLAVASQSLSASSCRPEIVACADPLAPSALELRGCRHPVAAARMGTSFVPNDTMMNACGVPGVLVVTGPNMGGKSTVLRQTCIAVVMAQLGCRVNAQLCRLSPVDRIFTRIGSYDMILEGKSTLLTELEETAAILQHGTRRSLAVLDELGRGTSTFDGAAIAAAVLDELVRSVGCMVLFATHYHPVSHEAARLPGVAPFHMAAEVDALSHEMTFLYRFLPGLCPASHGHHVARLAGLPKAVLDEALARSAEFEKAAKPDVRKCETGAVPVVAADVAQVVAEVVRLAASGDAEALRAFFRQKRQATA